jgi:hypothetical protein
VTVVRSSSEGFGGLASTGGDSEIARRLLEMPSGQRSAVLEVGMKGWMLATFLLVSFAGAGLAKDQEPTEKAFDLPAETVYPAMVQAVGSGLKSAVKEACTVNFLSGATTGFSSSNFFGNAVCHEDGKGGTVVALSLQATGRGTLSVGPAKNKVARIFWANLDAALKTSAAPDSGTARSQATGKPPGDDLATITVKSTPEGAEIAVDDKFSGSTPAVLRLPAGDHTLKIDSNGFRAWERKITLTPGGATTINATLQRE